MAPNTVLAVSLLATGLALSTPGIGNASGVVWHDGSSQPALNGQGAFLVAEDEADIVSFIDATRGVFTRETVQQAVRKVFSRFSYTDAAQLPEFMAMIAALGLDADVHSAMRTAIIGEIAASRLDPAAKEAARQAVVQAPQIVSDAPMLPLDGSCDPARRYVDRDCPPLTTGPLVDK